jgi:RNA polymerase sigma-70 factor (ECF subfamily)
MSFVSGRQTAAACLDNNRNVGCQLLLALTLSKSSARDVRSKRLLIVAARAREYVGLDWHVNCIEAGSPFFHGRADSTWEAGLNNSMAFDGRFRDQGMLSASANARAAAVDKMFASCMPGLRRTAERLLRNREDSEDVLQDALLSGFQKFHQFERRSKFSTWMHTILRNSARNMWRRRRCQPINSSFRFEESEEEELHSEDEVADGALNPEEKYRQKESSRIVAELLANLPPKYREVVWLCKIQELNVTDAAQRIGIQIGTVKARMHRARRMMAKCLNDRNVSRSDRLCAVRRLGIPKPDTNSLSRRNALGQVGIKTARREHTHTVRGRARELASSGGRIARNVSMHYPS